MTSKTFHFHRKNVSEFRYEHQLTLTCTCFSHLVSAAYSVPDTCNVLDESLRSANALALSSYRFSLLSISASSWASSSAVKFLSSPGSSNRLSSLSSLPSCKKVFQNNVKEEMFWNYVKAIKDSDLGPSGATDNVVNLQQELKRGKNVPGKTSILKHFIVMLV